MLQHLIAAVLRLLFPKLAAWVPEMLAIAIPAVIEAVQELVENKQLDGSAKYKLVVTSVATLLDEALDDVPEWGDLSEDKRDRILGGMTELALFIWSTSEHGQRTGNILGAVEYRLQQLRNDGPSPESASTRRARLLR